MHVQLPILVMVAQVRYICISIIRREKSSFFFQNADENIMGKYVQKILIVIVFEMSLFHFLYVSIAYKGR